MAELTCIEAITQCLRRATKPLAVHEMGIGSHNENNASTRLSEMARQGLVIGNKRPGKHYKEWSWVYENRNGERMFL